jgi:hypothetical protein
VTTLRTSIYDKIFTDLIMPITSKLKYTAYITDMINSPLLQSLDAVTQSSRGRGRVLQAEVRTLFNGLRGGPLHPGGLVLILVVPWVGPWVISSVMSGLYAGRGLIAGSASFALHRLVIVILEGFRGRVAA